MATNSVDQAKLVLNAFAATFQNNLIAADFVSWNMYNGEMNDRNALTVTEQVGPRYAVTQTTSGVQDLSSGVQDSVFGSEQFTVNQVFGSSMGWGDFVKIRDIGDARESTAIKNAATRLAEAIDGYILKTAVMASNNYVGTPANDISSWSDVATAYTRLKKEGVEDSDLRAVFTYDDKQALGQFVINNNSSALSDANGMFRQGFSGTVAGIPTAFTQQLSNLTTGTRTTGTVAGANQNVNYRDVAISGAPGRYLTQTLNIAGLGANATIKDGEVFTLGAAGTSVFSYDNRLQQVHKHLQQFRVIGDTTADGSGAATVRIFPAIVVPGSGSGGDISVNSANATVGSIPANGAAVTWLGTASTAYKPRVILHKEAISVNTAQLIMPATGKSAMKSLTKVPLSVRMWTNSKFETGDHSVRFDVALTANVRDRRRIIRLNGA